MIHKRPELRRIVAVIAVAAGASLSLSPAMATCTPQPAGTRPAHSFDISGDVVVARLSGLEWQRCSVGQTLAGAACQGVASRLDWVAAGKSAAAAGHGWRLPTNTELETLVLPTCSNPATDTALFPDTPGSWYWTSTTDGAAGAWFVDFEKGGGNGASLRTHPAAVRLVRNPGAH